MEYRKRDLSIVVWKKMVQGMEKALQNVVENQEERNQMRVMCPQNLTQDTLDTPKCLLLMWQDS